jgi:serine/threonine protein phosphatase PrpC/tRNA A-37 threonylcarbamoyl transferase component Bud32
MPTSGDFLKKRYMVNNYILLDSVGTGSYADVRLAKEKTSDRLYAVKVINKQVLRRKLTGASTMLDDVKREIAIMKKLSHPHVLRLFEVMDDPKVNKLYLVLEYMKLGDLMQIMRGDAKVYRCDRMREAPLWTVFRQVTSGLEYLHLQNIVHGDIKPQNLLLSEDGVLKIADFGISKMLAQEEALLETAGTPAFMCPEICAGEPYSGMLADVWALGVTMFMLRCGRPPFVADKVIRLYYAIIHDPLVFQTPLAEGLRALLRRMMEKDPANRASLKDVRDAEWLRQPPPRTRATPKDRPALAALEPRRDMLAVTPHKRFEKITVSAADLDGAIVAKRKSRRHANGEDEALRTKDDAWWDRRRLDAQAAAASRVLSSRDAEDKRKAFAKKHSKASMRRETSTDDDDASDDDWGDVDAETEDLDLAVALPNAAPTHVLERSRFKAPTGLTNPHARIACAWHSRRGQRPAQEDRVTVIPDLGELPGCDDPRYSGYAYMGIFDGHGGDACATYLQRELHADLVKKGSLFFDDTRSAISRAFRETDERCCAKLRAKEDGSGATAVVCVFDGPGKRLIVAHAGDSRCVLSTRGSRGLSLTQDHRLTRPDELARVRGAGGLVVNHRLNGTLAVSRSFGDVAHKGPVPAISATPEVRICAVSGEDEFVVLGCDGLWDALSGRVVANFIRGELNDHGDLQKAARAVTEEALRRGSVDNVSVILVALNQGDNDDEDPDNDAAQEVD